MLSLLPILLVAATAPDPALLKSIGEREVTDTAALASRACTITVKADELDKKGNAVSSSEIELTRTFENGKRTETITRYVEDGKDVTAEKLAEKAKRDEKKAKAAEGDVGDDDGDEVRSPFHPDLAGDYDFEDLGADPADPGRRKIRFSRKSSAKSEDEALGDGDAIVRVSDARIVEIQGTPAGLPPLVTVEMRSTFGPAGEMKTLDVSGVAGALFLKKRFRMTSQFQWAAP